MGDRKIELKREKSLGEYNKILKKCNSGLELGPHGSFWGIGGSEMIVRLVAQIRKQLVASGSCKLGPMPSQALLVYLAEVKEKIQYIMNDAYLKIFTAFLLNCNCVKSDFN